MKNDDGFHLGKNRGSGFDVKPFDLNDQYPVVRCSICTGEKVAGFKNRKTGRFTEVMLIRSPKDLQEFKDRYGVENVKTEY